MNYFIFQGNDHDCGFASLKMLMANFKHDKSYLYIKKLRRKDSLTVTDIIKEAGYYGLVLSSYGCDDDYYDQLKTPSLTLIRNNHVVVVKKVSKKKITYLDPEFGKVTVKKDEFLAIWCRIVIEIEKDYMSKAKKIRRSVLPLRLRILEAATSLISAAILIATFYLLNNEENAVFYLESGNIDITESERIHEFYETWLPHDSETVEFDWQSGVAGLYINLGGTRPTTKNADFKLFSTIFTKITPSFLVVKQLLLTKLPFS